MTDAVASLFDWFPSLTWAPIPPSQSHCVCIEVSRQCEHIMRLLFFWIKSVFLAISNNVLTVSPLFLNLTSDPFSGVSLCNSPPGPPLLPVV